MSVKRFIPKLIFQMYAFSLLAVWWAAVVYWTVTNSGLFYLFHTWLGLQGIWIWTAAFFAWVALLPVWLILVLPVRLFSQLPAPQEEMGVSLRDGLPAFVAGLKRLYAREEANNEEMYRAKEYTPRLASRARMTGLWLFLIGLVFTPVSIWLTLLILERGRLFSVGIIPLVISLLLLIAGVFQLVTGRSVVRRDPSGMRILAFGPLVISSEPKIMENAVAIKIDDYQRVWLFFAIAYAFSWIFWIPAALAASGVALPTSLVDFLASPLNPAAFGPLFAAFLLTFLQQGGKGVLQLLGRGVALFKRIWLLAILVLPIVLFGGPVWVSHLVGLRPNDIPIVSRSPEYVFAFFVILFTTGPLQEFGWRGYALPRLQSQFNALTSSVILGLFWWLWHLPAVFIPGKFMTDNLIVFLALFVVITLTSVLFTWIYNNTNGSVLAAILTHASMNWSMWLAMRDTKMDLSTSGVMIGFLAVTVLIIIKIWGAAHLSRKQRG